MTGGGVVCLLGPTGTGKTEAALCLAERFSGSVVNLDSRQVYADLPVITAQPTQAERSRCPHYLYGVYPLETAVSAGAFAAQVREAVAAIHAAGRLPLLVGGTGLYFKAVLGGLASIPPVPPAVRRMLQAACAAHGPADLHARLAEVDPAYAAKIAPADKQRVTRALEVYVATGRSFSDWHAAGAEAAPSYRTLRLGLVLPAAKLARRLERRIEAMLAAGALDEARRATSALAAGAPGATGIGVPELARHLRGETDLETAKAAWFKSTRDYAKRQMTWFRKDKDVAWFAPGEHEAMAAVVAAWLEEDKARP